MLRYTYAGGVTAVGTGSSQDLEWSDVVPASDDLVTAVRQLPDVEAQTGLVVQVPTGQIVAANPQAGELLGLSFNQLMGRTSMDPRWAAVSEEGLPLPGDRHPAMVTLATGEPLRNVLMGILLPPGAPDAEGGLTRWIAVDTDPLPGGVVARFRDASGTDRSYRAAERLLGSYRMLSEAVPGVVLHVDQDWIIRDYADAGQPGISDPLGRNVLDYVHPDERATVSDLLAAAQTAALAPRLDCRWECPDGTHRWVALQAHPILVGQDFQGAQIGLHDIDEAVQARHHLVEVSDELRRERVRLQQAMRASRLGSFEWDSATGAFRCDDAWAQLLGYSDAAELQLQTLEDWREIVHPDDLDAAVAAMGEVVAGHRERMEVEARVRHRSGDWVWIRSLGQVTSRSPGVSALSGVSEDVTERMAMMAALASSEEHYRLLAEHVTDAVWRVSPEGIVVWASESTQTLLGWRPEQVVGSDALTYLPEDYREIGRNGREAVHRGEVVSAEGPLRCADGSYRMVALTARPAVARDGVWEILAIRDIQREVEAREEVSRMALQDHLTSRPNAAAAIDHLTDSLADDEETGTREAVLIVGIDGLRTVNEAWSLTAGDRLIVEVGNRIDDAITTGGLGRQSFLARGPGDEFIVVLGSPDAAGDAAMLADRIRDQVRRPLRLADQALVPSVSIGIAVAEGAATPAALLRDAAAALQVAKSNGRDRHEFSDTGAAARAQERLKVASLIREGLRDGAFAPWYQPIVSLRSGRVVGYEALIRCSRDNCDLTQPDVYLPVAEATGLITELDRLVLRKVCHALHDIPAPRTVAVNVSPRTLVDPQYSEEIVAFLGEYPDMAGRLKLEVTETALLAITEDVLAVAADLASRGVELYADDFGTGYSSITHLRDPPLAGLKLDRSFTAGLGDGDGASERLSRAMIGLAEGMGLDSVAEGVETREQATILTAQGWRHAQGWFYGRPEPQPR